MAQDKPLCRVCQFKPVHSDRLCFTCYQYRRRTGRDRPESVVVAHGRRIVARDEQPEQITRRSIGQFGRLLEEAASRPVPHPLQGLPADYAKASRMVTVLEAFISALQDPLGENRFGEQVIHPLVVLYGEWLDRSAKLAKTALDANLDERQRQVDEAEAAELVGAIRAAKSRAALTPAQADQFDAALDEALAALDVDAA